jgi:23S rRNA (cytosine1962-C5)-methyltransferase
MHPRVTAEGMFANRLRKNVRHLRKWAARQGLSAFRVYDRDMPEYPFAVDWYAGRVHVSEYPRKRAVREGTADAQREEVLAAIVDVLEVPRDAIYTKTHLPKAWGREQYGRNARREERFVVEESGLKFWVNLGDYLDTGLFMDHRNTRARVREEARGKRFLNLFAYTGAFTVYAAAGGARSTTTVDLSNAYLDWAADNLTLNSLVGKQHALIRDDAMAWLEDARAEQREFDLIVVDPPSFSSSKKMTGSFNVQQDHVRLLDCVLAVLSPKGHAYFSTNFLGFELDEARLPHARFEELTPGSIPEDFHFKDIHRCWRVLPKR